MKLVIGSDHAGFPLKSPLIEYLKSQGHEVNDVGSYDPEPVDFPDIAKKLCAEIQTGKAERGLMVCGTGIGACMATNRFAGIRSAVAHDVYSAHQCVEHDDANVLCLGAQVIGYKVAFDLVRIYLDAKFSNEPEFRRRIEKLSKIDQELSQKK